MSDLSKYLLDGNVPKRKARRPMSHWQWVAGFSLAIIFTILAVHTDAQKRFGVSDTAIEPIAIKNNTTLDFVAPSVFQAAGPNIASIQGTITDFRAALGDPVNNNVLIEKDLGRREINWDGAPPTDATTPPVTPIQHFSEYPWRAVHHSGDRTFPGATFGWATERAGGSLRKFDLRNGVPCL